MVVSATQPTHVLGATIGGNDVVADDFKQIIEKTNVLRQAVMTFESAPEELVLHRICLNVGR